MSNWRGGRGDSSRGYRERGGYGGRDRRERSPERGDNRQYRGDRSSYGRSSDDRFSYQQPQGSRDRDFRGTDQRGRGGYAQSVPSEDLPSLPSEVSIPQSGARLILDLPSPKGNLGRSVNLFVNHFVIESLPTVKVRARRTLVYFQHIDKVNLDLSVRLANGYTGRVSTPWK